MQGDAAGTCGSGLHQGFGGKKGSSGELGRLSVVGIIVVDLKREIQFVPVRGWCRGNVVHLRVTQDRTVQVSAECWRRGCCYSQVPDKDIITAVDDET